MTEFIWAFFHNLKHFLINFYLFVPFVFVLVICFFMNNSVNIRRYYKLFFASSFFLCSGLLLLFNPDELSLFNLSFDFSKFPLVLSLLLNFVFLVFAFLSKTLIYKNHKAFYSLSLVQYSLINLFLFSDNVLFQILMLFWIFFVQYLLSYNFSYSKETKDSLKADLSLNLIILPVALCLIGFDFLRYFVINDIEFTFKNILENSVFIDPDSFKTAFFGVLLILLNLIKILPFDGNNLNNINKINPFCVFLNMMSGGFLFALFAAKTYFVFSPMFVEYAQGLGIYFLINLFWFAILTYGRDSLVKFGALIYKITFTFALIPFIYSIKVPFGAYMYYIVSAILSVFLLFSLGIVLFSKFKTDKISLFMPPVSKNRLLAGYVLFGLLNVAKFPLAPLAASSVYYLCLIMSYETESGLLEKLPYLLVLVLFIAALSSFEAIYKILTGANKKVLNNGIYLLRHQTLALLLIIFVLVIINLYPAYFINTAGLSGI